jgi:hypothetical protein
MSSRSSERALKALVQDLINADDPTLYDRACHALSTLLGEHDEPTAG